MKEQKTYSVMKKNLLTNIYEKPKCEVVKFETIQMIMLSGNLENPDVPDGDTDWIGRPGDIWDLL